jgi:hypothetical protein
MPDDYRVYSSGDFNGDGLTDLYLHFSHSNGRAAGTPNYSRQSEIWLSKGDGTFDREILPVADSMPNEYQVHSSGDFNGDGLTDLFMNYTRSDGRATGPQYNQAAQVWLAQPNGTFNKLILPVADGMPDYYRIFGSGDFNGDGLTDLYLNFSQSDGRAYESETTEPPYLWTSVGPMPGPLARVTSGLGVETLITYRPSTDASVYTRDSGANAADYPIVDTQPPMQVVSRVERPDGIGGTKVSTYHYKGAKVDLTGRGFLGFREMTETDEQTGITQTSEFYQYYQFTLTKKSQTRELNGITMSQKLNEYNSQDMGGTRKMIWLKQTLSSGADLNGVALPSKATYYQYDDYCNPPQITVSSSDGFSKVTTNTYLNDESNWLLGRLLTATVSSEAPAAGAQAPLEDIAPDPLLDITDVTNAALNTVYERGAVVAGTNRVVTATVSGGDAQIRKNGAGDWTSSIQIDPGETLNIRMTSGSAYDSVETATVTIGSANFDWTVTAAPLSRTLVIAENVNDLNLRTHHDSLYPPPVDGEPTPISVSAIVEPGVIVGSNSSTTPALDVGNWPNDVTLTINVQGRIQGHGGEGGNAATSTGYQTGYVDGKDGGTAFYTRHALTLDVGSGQIWGGGGGGGGGRIKDGGKHAGSGGGGAGQLPGQPGVKGHGGDNTVGQPGTTEAGGAGGPSGTGEAGGGGRGGDPGLDGANTNISGRTSLGGKAGKAIDAASIVISQIGTGDVRGPVLGGGGPCSGVEVGGYCWHVGAAGQSCDAVCSGYGSCDLAGTRDYAGSGGTLANCQSVATALGLSGSAANSESGNQGYGCTAISFLGTPLIIRVPSPATTCTASDGSMQRICACSN